VKSGAIGASHQSSAHLAKQFQRRRLLEIGQSETRIVCRRLQTWSPQAILVSDWQI
jgi:hypothetical protein